MARKILIVDDSSIDRTVLAKMLSNEYTVVEAEDGEEAYSMLRRNPYVFSAVVVDAMMPKMNGYELSEKIRSNGLLAQIPIVLITSDDSIETFAKAIRYGANNYITKPCNAELLLAMVKNNAIIRETAAIANELRNDKLTGILNRDAFMKEVIKLVKNHEAGYFMMASFNVNHFKIINDQYGQDMGDKVLKYLASVFQEGFGAIGGICCRVSEDRFAVLYPEKYKDSDIVKEIRTLASNIEGLAAPISFSIGRYIITEPSLSPIIMYDRALLAGGTAKNKYSDAIAYYDENVLERLLSEQQIVGEMERALAERQFEPWFQPQYNYATGALIGAEALVRWRRNGEIIPPSDFIGIFERNGFIYKLDQYVWREVCKALRQWIDEGKKPLPVSVNISRYDVFQENCVSIICGLVEEFDLPVDLLRLEITESAFSASQDQVIDIVTQFVEHGFTVEIDDFGSGYSSLNTLKDVPAQIIKMDMKFLESSQDSQRGGTIVESIVRMAKGLKLSVIAEGVETKEQADFLRSIGCNYIQGYLYARPMPMNDYEDHCKKIKKEEHLIKIETVENLNNSEFWNPGSIDTLIFNSYVGAACIFEYDNDKIEVVRSTEKFAEMISGGTLSTEDTLLINWSAYMDKKSKQGLKVAIKQSKETNTDAVHEILFIGLPRCPERVYIRATVRVIASMGDRHMVYNLIENTTARHEAEREVRKSAEEIQTFMSEAPGGFVRMRMNSDITGKREYVNDGFCKMLGITREEALENHNRKLMEDVHPDDYDEVLTQIKNAVATGEVLHTKYRLRSKSGEYVWMQISARFTKDEEGDIIVNCYYADLSEKEKRDLTVKEMTPFILSAIMKSSTDLAFAKDKDFNYLCCSPAFVKFARQKTEADVIGKNDYDFWTKEEADHFRDDDIRLFESGESLIDFTEPIPSDDGIQHYAVTSKYILRNQAGEVIGLYGLGRDVTDTRAALDRLQLLTDSIPGGIVTYAVSPDDIAITYYNDGFCKLFNCTREEYDVLVAEKGVVSLVFPEDLPEIMKQLDELVKNGTPMDCRYRSYKIDKSGYVWLNLRGTIGDRHDDTVFVNTVIYDITARVAEQKRHQEILPLILSTIMKSATDYTFAKDKDLCYINASPAFIRLAGVKSEQDVIGKTDFDLFPDDMARQFRENDVALMEGEMPLVDYDEIVHELDGTIRYCRASKYLLRDETGQIIGIYGASQDITKEHDALEQLRMSEEENILAIQHSGNIVGRYDVESRKLSIEPSIAIKYSIPAKLEDVPYKPVQLGNISPETSEAYTGFFEAIINGSSAGNVLYQENYLGEWRWTEAKSSTIFSNDGKPVKAVISFFDVTEKLEKETIYKRWQHSLKDRDPDSYTMFRCNLNKNTTYETKEGTLFFFEIDKKGKSFNDRSRAYAIECVHEEERDKYIALLNADTLLANYYRGNRSGVLDYREKMPDGNIRWIRVTIDLVESASSTDVEAHLMYENIDDVKKKELQTKRLSETDSLTGLLNRATFISRVNNILQNNKPKDKHALLMIDIDNFKQVNDVFGHVTGDETLVELAKHIRSMMRQNDILARLGGDEFGVFLCGVKGVKDAKAKAKKLCSIAHKSLSMEVQVSVSIGIACSPYDGIDFETLYPKADSALYYVKGSGKNNVVVYSEDMSEGFLNPEPDTVEAGGTNIAPKKRRMLIVEDSSIDLEFLQKIFNDEFIIEKAKDGNSALIRLNNYGTAISVVLLDLMMPGMNGYTVLEKMQESEELREIPVIMVSGDESRDTCITAIRNGAVDFVTKPVDADILRVRVQSAISKAENKRLREKIDRLQSQ